MLNRRRWRHVRLKVLKRDRYRCRSCGKPGKLEVDHTVPLQQGGAAFDIENLATRCVGCHRRKTTAENKRPPGPRAAAWDALVGELSHAV